MWLRGSARWPQPNAKKIRLVAQDLNLRFEAMNADATENDYVWTMEERFELLAVLPQFRSLIWPHTLDQDNELRNRFEGYRKTPPNDRLPLSWKRIRLLRRTLPVEILGICDTGDFFLSMVTGCQPNV